jgi:hypothetical protein
MNYNTWIKNVRTTPNSSFYPESLIRFQPASVNVPEGLGTIATVNVAGMRELTLLHQSNGNLIEIENQTTLEKLSMPNLGAPAANIVVKTNAALASLLLPNINLPTHGSSLTGASLDFSANALGATFVDALYNRLALSLSSGTAYYTKIDTSGGTNAAPTSASSLARSSLYLTKTGYEITVATA